MIRILSFGYRNGKPDADRIIDCRAIRNPYNVPGLRDRTWMDEELQDYIIDDPRTEELLLEAVRAIGGSSDYTLALGCHGGQHRSVVLAELLKNAIYGAEVSHLDLKEDNEVTE